MAKGDEQVMVWIQDEMNNQGLNPSSSWLDTLHRGVMGAVEMKCAGGGGPGADKGLAASRGLVCC